MGLWPSGLGVTFGLSWATLHSQTPNTTSPHPVSPPFRLLIILVTPAHPPTHTHPHTHTTHPLPTLPTLHPHTPRSTRNACWSASPRCSPNRDRWISCRSAARWSFRYGQHINDMKIFVVVIVVGRMFLSSFFRSSSGVHYYTCFALSHSHCPLCPSCPTLAHFPLPLPLSLSLSSLFPSSPPLLLLHQILHAIVRRLEALRVPCARMATVIRQREEAECERERDKERVREAGTSVGWWWWWKKAWMVGGG